MNNEVKLVTLNYIPEFPMFENILQRIRPNIFTDINTVIFYYRKIKFDNLECNVPKINYFSLLPCFEGNLRYYSVLQVQLFEKLILLI